MNKHRRHRAMMPGNLFVRERVPFSREAMPTRARRAGQVVHVEFSSCPRRALTCRVAKILERGTGLAPQRAIWVINAEALPLRVLYMSKGMRSLRHFLLNAGHLDGNACVHTGQGTLGIGELRVDEELPIALELVLVPGVPQGTVRSDARARRSGLCWFSAVCWALAYPARLRDAVASKLPALARGAFLACLTDVEQAEVLRRFFWYSMRAGDDVDAKPEEEGRNGFSEAATVLARLDIPLLRFRPDPRAKGRLAAIRDPVVDRDGVPHEPRVDPTAAEAAVLAVRCFRTRWRPRRRISHGGRIYYLVSALVGSMDCKHQQALATEGDMRVCRWSAACSDRILEGVHPEHWCIRRQPHEAYGGFRRRWWDTHGKMTQVTIFKRPDDDDDDGDGGGGGAFCDFRIHNRPQGELESAMRGLPPTEDEPGNVNVDYLYVSPSAHVCAARRPKSIIKLSS
jgi:hypothetical protein